MFFSFHTAVKLRPDYSLFSSSHAPADESEPLNSACELSSALWGSLVKEVIVRSIHFDQQCLLIATIVREVYSYVEIEVSLSFKSLKVSALG